MGLTSVTRLIAFLSVCALTSAPASVLGSVFASTSTSTSSAGEVSDVDRALIESAFGASGDGDAAGQSVGSSSSSFASFSGAIQSMNPEISLILDAAAAYFDGEPMQLGGHDPNKTGFSLQQLELHMAGSVDPFFRLDANIVFALFGVEVEEVYATTLALPYGLQARGGQFLTRFGRINATHPHAWSFVDQPLVIGKFFGSEGNRGLGAELSWLSPLPWYFEVSLSANNADGECCARSFLGADDFEVRGPLDLLYTTTIKQFFPFNDSWSLSLGLSGQFGPNASGYHNRTAIFGTDVYLRYRPVDSAERSALSLQAEGLYRRRQIPDGLLDDFGIYAQLVWNITPEWEVGGRFEHVSGVSDDPLDPDWTRPRRRTSLEATFYPSHFSRLRLQGSYDEPLFASQPVYVAMFSLEVMIGAHGAHSF
ncbi:MAG: zinc-regulated TonB-dependent outer membrane receptor [Deltaproteobacteria bacterium]|nr:zinc-regulated TonB-dependent outer membrane receptor [Deltaproteobacteria bacterium]